MRAESIKQPKAFEVFASHSGTATVYFAENVQEKLKKQSKKEAKKRRVRGSESPPTEADEELVTVYEYDSYSISVPYRDTLESDIEKDYAAWLERAKSENYEKKAAEIRAKRDKLLSDTDKEMCIDRILKGMSSISTTSLTAKLKELNAGELAAYRQALRDIPQQEGFPFNVIFPVKPD